MPRASGPTSVTDQSSASVAWSFPCSRQHHQQVRMGLRRCSFHRSRHREVKPTVSVARGLVRPGATKPGCSAGGSWTTPIDSRHDTWTTGMPTPCPATPQADHEPYPRGVVALEAARKNSRAPRRRRTGIARRPTRTPDGGSREQWVPTPGPCRWCRRLYRRDHRIVPNNNSTLTVAPPRRGRRLKVGTPLAVPTSVPGGRGGPRAAWSGGPVSQSFARGAASAVRRVPVYAVPPEPVRQPTQSSGRAGMAMPCDQRAAAARPASVDVGPS